MDWAQWMNRKQTKKQLLLLCVTCCSHPMSAPICSIPFINRLLPPLPPLPPHVLRHSFIGSFKNNKNIPFISLRPLFLCVKPKPRTRVSAAAATLLPTKLISLSPNFLKSNFRSQLVSLQPQTWKPFCCCFFLWPFSKNIEVNFAFFLKCSIHHRFKTTSTILPKLVECQNESCSTNALSGTEGKKGDGIGWKQQQHRKIVPPTLLHTRDAAHKSKCRTPHAQCPLLHTQHAPNQPASRQANR